MCMWVRGNIHKHKQQWHSAQLGFSSSDYNIPTAISLPMSYAFRGSMITATITPLQKKNSKLQALVGARLPHEADPSPFDSAGHANLCHAKNTIEFSVQRSETYQDGSARSVPSFEGCLVA